MGSRADRSWASISTFGIALLFLGLGFAIQVSYPNFAHITESALLALALYSQSRGHRGTALAFACAGLFCKPSMSYVYGLILVILITMDLLRSRVSVSHFVRAFAPAAITGTVLIVIFATLYSPVSAIRTLFPVEGAIAYHDQNFGFFSGIGRRFWNPPNVPWIYYLFDFSGFWIGSSIFLAVSGAMAWTRWHRQVDANILDARRDEILWTCAILHLAFVFLFFGNQWSWICYSFILVLGVSLAGDLSPIKSKAGVAPLRPRADQLDRSRLVYRQVLARTCRSPTLASIGRRPSAACSLPPPHWAHLERSQPQVPANRIACRPSLDDPQ